MHLKIPYKLTFFTILCSLASAWAQISPVDTLQNKKTSSFFYNWKDTYLNRFNYRLSPALSINPDSLKTKVLYNGDNKNFTISENINSKIDVKIPESMTFNEYSSIQNAMLRQSILRDIEKAQDGNSSVSGKRINPLLEKNPIMDRIFGDKVPEFKPNGYVSVSLRAGTSFVNNPMTPLALRRQPIFDMDQQIAINFNNLFGGGQNSNANEGDFDNSSNQNSNNSPRIQDLKNIVRKAGQTKEKMNILGNFDTKSSFGFENKFKLNFKNEPEDILQKVELGNITMPNRTQLIPGVQNLFGAKLGFKFGKLDITTVFAQQNSRTESIMINGGSQSRKFEFRCDNYDENRHFFISHFFRDQYEKSLKNLPMLTSGVRITRIEVYVTNRTNNVSSMRNLVGLADLAEKNPYRSDIIVPNKTILAADNKSNNLFSSLVNDESFRRIDNSGNILTGMNLKNGEDFELLRGAKKLTDREFEIQPELGYISLLTPLRNDEILAVAYEYTYQGRAYKVGELTEDYVSRKEDEVIMLKLLKSSTIRNRLNNPMWDLMMKNVYSLAQGQIQKEGFQLRIIYKDDQTGMDTPNLREGKNFVDVPLIEAMKLDKLNFNNDPKKDGNFDYVENVTINERYGRIIFPVLEPFGSHLNALFEGEPDLQKKYVFDELYRKTLMDAQQVSLKNKFFISGSVQSGGSEISLPLGASGSSVRVYAGGSELKQGVDYTVDNQQGTIRITNQSILSSGRQIRIDYEKPDIFQAQIRRLFGLRLDYTISRHLRIGATLLSLKENTPGFITRTSIGNEPVNNTIWGLDANFKKDVMGLTKLLDKLPGIQTKEVSTIMFNAEFAQLRPGVNNKRVKGSSMIDDFEFARNINDLSRQPTKWRLGSTPEAILKTIPTYPSDAYAYNYNRAKISAYTVDMSAYISTGGFGANSIIPDEVKAEANSNIYTKGFQIQDIFPGRSRQVFAQQLPSAILDLAYYPTEPGMYNYNSNLNSEGRLSDPKKNFGSVMRGITFDADFDNSNVEYLEFWLLDPFADVVRASRNEAFRNTTGGKLLIQLGDISEDVIPDSRFNFENGIKDSTSFSSPVKTDWGLAPKTQFITDAFDNSESVRLKQDVGLDGLSNEDERNYVNPNNATNNQGIKGFLSTLEGRNLNADAFEKIKSDPSKDDFHYFLDPIFDASQATFLERFKDYLGMENNAPPITSNTTNLNTTSNLNQASTNLADKEDINQDNTINQVEDYFEYEVELSPTSGNLPNSGALSGNSYIVDKVTTNGATWYLHRIPIRKPTRSFPAGKEGFKSMRFIRLVTTEWEQPVVLRFASLQLVSNQYRVYANSLSDESNFEVPQDSSSTAVFKTSSVNVEENGCPLEGDCNIKPGTTPYVVPPGFIRDRDFTTQIFTQLNEQSLSMSVEDLRGGEARAVFKNTKLDLNMYKRIKMFVHTQNKENQDGIASAFIRIGTDLKNNYYEIEIPNLKNTINGSQDPYIIWPKENELDISLDILRNLKLERNRNLFPMNKRYGGDKLVDIEGTVSGPIDGIEENIIRQYKISVIGNPDFSNVLTMMIGLKNNDTINKFIGREFTIWCDELRAFGFDQENGEAGIFSADIKLADVGTILLNGNFKNYGFGGVQDRISTRSREVSQGFGIASNIAIDKFFPLKWGLSIPFFANYDHQMVIPTFNPLDPDIRLDDALLNRSIYQQNLTREIVSEDAVTKGFNFTNVRKTKTKTTGKDHFYDIENFTFSYAQNRIERRSILLDQNLQTQTRAGLSYQYSPKGFTWEPFKKFTGFDKPFLKNVKTLNLSPIPTLIAFRGDYNRSYFLTQYRNSNLETSDISPNVIKYFLGNRFYDTQWNLTKSIVFSYNAQMTSIQDDINEITDDEIKFIDGLTTLGRPKNYMQKMQATYRLPLDKFFLLDWMKADTRFNNNYGYTAGSFKIEDENGDAFGNMLENGRELAINGQVDLVKLYNKLKFLRMANAPNPPKQRFTRAPGDDEEVKLQTGSVTKSLTRVLMTLRGINADFALFETTLLPGFLPSPKFFGMDGSNEYAPGIEFVMGSQNRNIHKIAAQKGWLSQSIIQNNPFTQTRGVKFNFGTRLEPFKGLTMQIKGNLTRADSYQEMYRPETVGGSFQSLNPVRNGSFSMSFWSFKTGFTKMSNDSASLYQYQIFDNMVGNRQKVLDRLNGINTNAEGQLIGKYDLNSQDVLIPAFFSAYSGQSLDKIFAKSIKKGGKTFNPFLSFPMPNWRIDYQGLEKLPLFKQVFNSITLSHQYSSTYSVGNFTSSLEYGNQLLNLAIRDYPLGDKTIETYANIPYLNSNTPLFAPAFIMSTISMEEKFSPVIGVQFTTKRNFTGSFNWNKERKAALNLSNAQVAEYNSKDFVFGIGYKKNNVKLPFRGRDGNLIVLKNDVNFRIDITSRDLKVLQRRLDGDVVPIQGNYNLQIRPQLQYQFNKKINAGMYWERLVNTPFTSLSYQRTSSIFGINARFNLSD
ncbi:cell surface protein SprA [Lacihabitans sp. LS3-19]|uniref:T9SS outer membrane translocon Sov/SprA n=1 Tax=Lacihabitans sp. LS3-19 TaxID=2487335 RepID=UPI0020CC5A7F|nr:cell surface protein SprA [Lacihabitans sp. LS3-19]MCP9767735.1 cell surface protein SprA [Lacihabitans sp. LS3-19]